MQLSLVQIIGLIILGGACFLLGITAPEVFNYSNGNRTKLPEEIFFIFLLGGACFIVGIATLLKKKWTRSAITMLLASASLFICYISFVEFPRLNNIANTLYFVFSVMMVLSLLIGGILYINNEKVIADYEEEEGPNLLEEEILDL